MDLIPDIRKAAQKAGIEYEIYITKGKEDGIAYARSACQKHAHIRLYACGGDGTLNDLVNAVKGCDQAEVGMIPCGSGNDFIKIIGNPAGYSDMDKQISAPSRAVDTLWIGERMVSLNITNIGVDADAAHYMSRIKRIPFMSGKMSYHLGVLLAALKPLGKELSLRFDDGETVSGKFMLTAICNRKIYGGGYMAAPQAQPDDGLLDVCLVRKMSRLKMAQLIEIYKNGRHLVDERLKPYIVYRRCRWVELTSPKPFRLCNDGEIFEAESTRFEIKPGSLKFIVPDNP